MLPSPPTTPIVGAPSGRWTRRFGSALGRVEDALYGRRLAEMDADPAPIVVLGLWGQGGDALRDLLARDPAHATLTTWQAAAPEAAVTAGRVGRWVGAPPADDEVALARLTGMSPFLARPAAETDRYLDFLEVRHAERTRWKNALVHLVKKGMLATGRRLILSSPAHGSRIRMLLEAFPEVRFVHVHQHPYAVFGAMAGHPDERAALGERVYERLIEDRRCVPAGQLVEIAYDDLRVRPIDVLASVYARLGLPEWERARTALTARTGRIGRAEPERLLPRAQRDLVWSRWRRVFDTYGYDRELVCGI